MIAIPNMDKPKRCELCPCSYYSEGALSDICQITNEPIDGTPTDCPLIEIVRCGECKHRDSEFCQIRESMYGIKDNDFCSYGERRTDDI